MPKIFLTGASSGIGYALAKQLAGPDTHLVLAARRKPELEALAAELVAVGAHASVQELDVSDTAKTVEVIRQWDAELGGFDMVIANAGMGTNGSGKKLQWEQIAPMLKTNFDGAIATMTAVLPQMLERKRGHLVAVSSIAGYAPLPGAAGYGATKAGLSYFCESLRQDLLGTGVAVTAIHPGFVRTPLVGKSADKRPFLVELDDAVRHIADRLPGRPATIDFPFPILAGAKIANAMPRFVRNLVVPRLVLRKK